MPKTPWDWEEIEPNNLQNHEIKGKTDNLLTPYHQAVTIISELVKDCMDAGMDKDEALEEILPTFRKNVIKHLSIDNNK
jgi:hypothetical protein